MKYLIEIEENKPKSYIETTFLTEGVQYFKNQIEIEDTEININELADYEIVNNKLVKRAGLEEEKKAKIIDNFKLILQYLKTEYSQKEFIFKEKYKQKNRDLDKNNLTSIVVMMNATKQKDFRNWKFKDLEDNDVYVDITIEDMLILANTMQAQTTKAMIIESQLVERLKTLSIDELNTIDIRGEYGKLWNK